MLFFSRCRRTCGIAASAPSRSSALRQRFAPLPEDAPLFFRKFCMPIKPTRSEALQAIFSKNFVAISLINMLGLAGYYAIFVVSTRYLAEVFHASTGMAGLATGIIVIGCLVGRFFTGSIVQTAGYLRVLVTGVLLYLFTNIAYFFADSLALIFLVRFISGVAIGIIGTVTGTLVAVIVPAQYHGRGIAYFSMSTALALCFGPFIGIALLGSLGYEGIFAIGTGLACVNLLLLPLVRVKAQRGHLAHKLTLADFIEPKLIPFSLLVCATCLAWGNIQAFMAAYAQAFDVVAAASLFFLVYAVAILVSRPFSGKIYDAHGPAVILYPAYVLLAVGLGILWLAPSSATVLISGALAGLGFGNFQSVAQVNAISMVDRDRYAQATSTFYIFFDLGIGVAPYLGGTLAPTIGYDGIYGLNSLIVVVCLFWYAILERTGRLSKRPARGNAVDFSKAKKN